jgi:hypothetical protein
MALGGPPIYPSCSPWIGVSRIIFTCEDQCREAGGHCFEASWDKRELERNPQAQRCKHCNKARDAAEPDCGDIDIEAPSA